MTPPSSISKRRWPWKRIHLQCMSAPIIQISDFQWRKLKRKEQLNELQWLIDIIKLKGKDTPKTMLFCNTINEVASVANHLLFKLGIHAYDENFNSPENCLLGIYHSNRWQASKDRILASLKGNGPRRVVVCTTALCMGVNFPNIRYVIIWGAATRR